MTPGLSNDFGGGEEKRRVKIIDVIKIKNKKSSHRSQDGVQNVFYFPVLLSH